jgi:AraC family transcriptional regulator
MRMNTDNQFSSFFDYAKRGYLKDFAVENHLVGSQGISLNKSVQPTGDFSDPPLPDLSITYKRSGYSRGCLDVGGGLFDVSGLHNGFAVISPQVATTVLLEGHYELYAVAIPGEWAKSLLEPYKAATSLDFGKLHTGVQQDKAVMRLVEQLHHKETLESNNALLVDGLVMALLGRLVTLADVKNKPRTIKALDAVVLEYIEDFLQEDFCNNPTMQDLANLVDMSVDHFGKSFKKATGQTPYHYILEKRLEKAKQLLEDSRLSLVEVALAVGFASQAHMNKRFKEHFAVTPGMYRKGLA